MYLPKQLDKSGIHYLTNIVPWAFNYNNNQALRYKPGPGFGTSPKISYWEPGNLQRKGQLSTFSLIRLLSGRFMERLTQIVNNINSNETHKKNKISYAVDGRNVNLCSSVPKKKCIDDKSLIFSLIGRSLE